MGLLRTVLTLGMIPLGALLAYRLPAPTGSRWAQIACLLVYVTVPLPYNALADGRWGALVLYAAAPAAGRDARQREPGGALRARSAPPDQAVPASVVARPGAGARASSPRSSPRSCPSPCVIVVVMAVALASAGVIAMNPAGERAG